MTIEKWVYEKSYEFLDLILRKPLFLQSKTNGKRIIYEYKYMGYKIKNQIFVNLYEPSKQFYWLNTRKINNINYKSQAK